MEGVIFITTLSLFHFFRNSQHPEKSSVSFTVFFREYLLQELLFADILKLTKKVLQKNFTFFAYCDRCFGKKCSVSCIFQVIVVIVVIKILEKYWGKSSVLENNFQKLFVSILSRILTINSRIPFLKNSPIKAVSAPCSILVDNS